MVVITVTIAALIAVVVALLSASIVVTLDARLESSLEATWRVRWLFGLIDFSFANGQAKSAKPEAMPRVKKRGQGGRTALAVIRSRGFIPRVERLLAALIRQVVFERFHLDVVFGFDSPADTGMVYGCLSPLLVMAQIRQLDVRCRPTFVDEELSGVCQATVRVRPILVVGVILGFLLSPAVWRAMAAGWRARRADEPAIESRKHAAVASIQ